MNNPLEDFSGNINLHPSDKRYQFLMASQNYGTLFGVFGKFIIEKKVNTYYLTELDLKIINYKGLLNIGFAVINKCDLTFEKNNEFKMDISVQGLTNKFTEQAKIPSKFDVTNVKKMTFNKVLNYLNLDQSNLSQSGVFDNEFHYRDGIQKADETRPESGQREIRPGMVNYDNQKLVSRNCHTSILYVTNVDPSEFKA